MASSKVAIDGLWRCLCPAIDQPATQRLLRTAQTSQRHGRIPPTRAVITSVSQHRKSSTITTADEVAVTHNIDSAPGSSSSGVKITRASKKFESPRFRSHGGGKDGDKLQYLPSALNATDTETLRERLRKVKGMIRPYDRVRTLVEYLLKERGEKPSIALYDALIKANADAMKGSAMVVKTLRDDMKKAKITPTSEVYHSMLQALAVHPDYLLRAEILDEMHGRWFSLNEDGWHYVVAGLLRDRQYELALEKLKEMQENQITVQPWLYDVCIYLLCTVDGVDEAVAILQQRVATGELNISAAVWLYVLEHCSRNYHYAGTKFVWDQRVRMKYINPPDGMCTNVINTAARYHDPVLAAEATKLLVERGSQVELHHYEGLLEAYAESKDLENCIRILCLMQRAHLEPQPGSTRPLVAYLVTDPELPVSAYQIMKQLESEHQVIPAEAVNAVIEAAVLQDQLGLALQMYQDFKNISPFGANTTTFDHLLRGFANTKVQDIEFGVTEIASQMAKQFIHPSRSTYEYLILGCIREKLFKSAFLYLEEMQGFSYWPRLDVLEQIIYKFAAAGDDHVEAILNTAQRKENRESARARLRKAREEGEVERQGTAWNDEQAGQIL